MVTGIHACSRRQIWPLADGDFRSKNEGKIGHISLATGLMKTNLILLESPWLFLTMCG